MPTAAGGPAARLPRAASGAEIGRLDSSSSFDAGGFAPGAVIAERYRIIGLLGRGGMGEVYRADDLKLGQSVALKFLPSSFSKDAVFLDRFRAEVRNARQVSHPNVCRVYDIGEVDGHHFLSMEYVDGENLATLLRRIGRLPGTKALEIARQLCAGLAAAHAQGVLHRDIKPSNVMIDGHGRAKLTDFGLAVRDHEAVDGEVSGTPAYMAPEQIAGRGATVQSDLYSLGLVLYEVYTGKKTFEASSFADWRRAHTEEQPTALTHHAADIDAAVERAILRCLEKDPTKRPASAPQLAAALPGGDPLAAAIAAGETPSPEMVAAANIEGALAPAKAWALLAAVVVLAVVATFLAPYSTLTGLAPIEKSPQYLAESAREMARKFGYTDPPADSSFWFDSSMEFLVHQSKAAPSNAWFPQLSRSEWTPVEFFYRESPLPLFPLTRAGLVDPQIPAHEAAGMITMRLDSRGRLLEFRAQPRFVKADQPPPDPDWNIAFSAAGLDPARFTKSAPAWLPPVPYDARMAWEGSTQKTPDTRLQVQAASYAGKLVYFEQRGPWPGLNFELSALGAPRGAQQPSTPGRIIGLFIGFCFFGGFVGAALLARHNLRLGRGDRKGALRLAIYYFLLVELSRVLITHRTGYFWLEFGSLLEGVAYGLLFAAILWSFYMAMEPFARRRWPLVLTSWARLLGGGFRDTLVGRDILIGAATGALLGCLVRLIYSLPVWFPIPRGVIPFQSSPEFPRLMFGGPAELLAQMLDVQGLALVWVLFCVALIVLLRVVLRRTWAALAVYFVFAAFATMGPPGAANGLLNLAAGIIIAPLQLFILFRVGLLAWMAAQFVAILFYFFPLTFDFSRWYAAHGLAAIVVALALAVYGFRLSLAGRPLFSSSLDD
jgi:serine/threonine-protein kinase